MRHKSDKQAQWLSNQLMFFFVNSLAGMKKRYKYTQERASHNLMSMRQDRVSLDGDNIS